MTAKKKLRWEPKNSDQPKRYGTRLTKTDYDIPSFSYKSAFIMIGVFVLVLTILPMAFIKFGISPAWPSVILGGVLCGFTVAYLQFVREKKEGISHRFWMIGSLLSVVSGVIIYLLYFYKIMI